MTTIHPAFDPKTATWFADGGFEAPTLAALKALLPPRTKIKGYYPQGFAANRGPLFSASTRAAPRGLFATPLLPKRVRVPDAPPKEPEVQVVTQPVDNDKMLDDWCAGMSTWRIADKYGLNERNVRKKISGARAVGDPRAVWRRAKPGHYDTDEILRLWAAGWTGPAIGKKLGLPAPTTAGVIVAYWRKKGDPRATVRDARRIVE